MRSQHWPSSMYFNSKINQNVLQHHFLGKHGKESRDAVHMSQLHQTITIFYRRDHRGCVPRERAVEPSSCTWHIYKNKQEKKTPSLISPQVLGARKLELGVMKLNSANLLGVGIPKQVKIQPINQLNHLQKDSRYSTGDLFVSCENSQYIRFPITPGFK